MKKALWIFRELITTTRRTRAAFWDPPSRCKKINDAEEELMNVKN